MAGKPVPPPAGWDSGDDPPPRATGGRAAEADEDETGRGTLGGPASLH
ncbi:MAG: hypothetical protein KatS3mg121_1094 [Gammaproteobacteria bacterium]|nr:MAG: hypothetical protein KatS3mg121_1094 [Gammaproteobacteria bacterium]